MARTRSMKPEFKDDEKLASVSRDSRLTFAIMWGVCDDYGVCKGHAAWLKSNIYPYDDIDLKTFESWLTELEGIDAIRPFEADGEHYYYVVNFLKHQKIDHPSKQRNPEPPKGIREGVARQSRKNREESRKSPPQTETETETETETIASNSAKPESEHQKIIDYFFQKFKDKYGKPYNFGAAKEGALVKRMLKLYKYDLFISIIDQFFVSTDTFIQQAGHSFSVLSSVANKMTKELGDAEETRKMLKEVGEQYGQTGERW